MSNDEFRLEEYKVVNARKQIHEDRYYQMLILSFTSFVAILGLSDKLQKELIPFMLSSAIFLTTIIAAVSREHQFFNAAYLIEAFYKRTPSLAFEQTYLKVFSGERNITRIRRVLSRFSNILQYPFTIINLLSMIVSVYFGASFIKGKWMAGEYGFVIAYITLLLSIHLMAVRILFIRHRRKTSYYQRLCEEAINNLGEGSKL